MEHATERILTRPTGVLSLPFGRPRCAVLVLSGSSGRIETDRVRLLAQHGAAALFLRWFGDVYGDVCGDTGQPPGICEVPLETFVPALEQLAGYSDHLAVLGTSKGAEAALLLAAHDARIRTVAALSPSSVVRANVGPGLNGQEPPPRSSWTRAGSALPFVPYDQAWHDARTASAATTGAAGAAGTQEPLAFRTLYEQSLVTFAAQVPAARIPVELIRGDVLLSASSLRTSSPAGLLTGRPRRASPGRQPDTACSYLESPWPAVVARWPGEQVWRHLADVLRLR